MNIIFPIGAVQDQLESALKNITQADPVEILTRLLTVRDFVSRLWDKIHYRGMYEILDYDSTIDLRDTQGTKAILTRREEIRFLQDNIVAIHDHAWGDGELFAKYQCQPGVPVDIYEDGSKYNILISLRETKNKGDKIQLWIERIIKRGFCEKEEWLETEIDHWMHKLTLAIIFPKERPCRRAILARRSSNYATMLTEEYFALLPDGRQKLTWGTDHPKLHDCYTIKWVW